MEELEMDVSCSEKEAELHHLAQQIRRLFSTRLSPRAITVWQEKLLRLRRSSYQLEIRGEDVPRTDERENRPLLSEGAMWAHIDPQRLARAMAFANTRVRLLLTLYDTLLEDVLRGCCELGRFMDRYTSGQVDGEALTSAQQTLQQTLDDVGEYERWMQQRQHPLHLPCRLIPDVFAAIAPRLRAALCIKLPVVIDRSATHATTTKVHLSWAVSGEEAKDPDARFEVEVTNMHPTIGDNKSGSKCPGYKILVSNLTPDRHYLISVRWEESPSTVYKLWTDAMVLKTEEVKKDCRRGQGDADVQKAD